MQNSILGSGLLRPTGQEICFYLKKHRLSQGKKKRKIDLGIQAHPPSPGRVVNGVTSTVIYVMHKVSTPPPFPSSSPHYAIPRRFSGRAGHDFAASEGQLAGHYKPDAVRGHVEEHVRLPCGRCQPVLDQLLAPRGP